MPEAMDEVLTNWDEETRRTRRPRVVLMVPTGQNPSGATMGEERRRRVLEVARKWDVVSLVSLYRTAEPSLTRRVVDSVFLPSDRCLRRPLVSLPRMSLAGKRY